MGENRIIKFLLDEDLNGCYTTFYQFSGRMGPSAIYGYGSKFYVSLFEFNTLTNVGMVVVLNYNGEMTEKLLMNFGAEITGVFVYEEDTDNEEEVMVVSQRNCVYRIPLKHNEEESKLSESVVLSKG